MATKATTKSNRRKRRTAKTRGVILRAMKARDMNPLQVATAAKIPQSVVYDFLGPRNRDVTLSHAERIWSAVGLEIAEAIPR
jgi:hypothetical protein